MENNLSEGVIAISEQNSQEILRKVQGFQKLLNSEPDQSVLENTPDSKAKTIPISFIEMKLDELFFGQWSLSEPHYQREFNEIIGTATLTVIHPITGREIKRTGFASVIITQDSGASLQDFNSTKKKNALDLTFPKLKAEILKNAAASFGKIFGRDINRKKQAAYKPIIAPLTTKAKPELIALYEGSFTKEFTNALKALKTKSITMDALKQQFSISAEVEQKLNEHLK